MRSVSVFLASVLVASTAAADWWQWGRNAQHDNSSGTAGQRLERLEAEVVLDPFADEEKEVSRGNLLVHYPAPLVDGSNVYVTIKSGTFTGSQRWDSMRWNIRNLRWEGRQLETQWTFASDWRPAPAGSPAWEPVYHAALSRDAVWALGAGGTIFKIRRDDGSVIARYNPFGTTIDDTIFTAGPPAVDRDGNVYYTAMQLDQVNPWTTDVRGAWLVWISGRSGAIVVKTFASLIPNAPAASSQCLTSFTTDTLPWPPSPTAVPPAITCGSQRPGVNVAPAVAEDGTVYLISRAHFADKYGYLVALTRDLAPKWAASLRNRLTDGCDVGMPRNGTPGGCRAGANRGVDPSDNLPGSGRVRDDATSSPVVAPDGRILYGAYTRYNYSQGHLMAFDPSGNFVAAYPFGWDITPSIWRHDGTYSIVLKENRYEIGTYCTSNVHCPANRSTLTPADPERYLITQLDPSLRVEWQFRATNTRACERDDDGTVQCAEERPNGFEWCVNALAVDPLGVVFANSEDGNLYAIEQGGRVRQNIFLRLALGAAYTPLSIGSDGRIYTQNDGRMFVVGEIAPPRRRAARP